MKTVRCVLLLLSTLCATSAWAAPAKREPHIGYVFPAGGRQGSAFEVTLGGEFLRGVTDVYVSGEGVRASVIKHYPPQRNVTQEQRQELRRRLAELAEKRLAELPENRRPPMLLARLRAGMGADRPMTMQEVSATQEKGVELPDHPLLRDLEKKSLRELLHVTNEFLSRDNFMKKQRNAQIAEMVLIKVTVDADAPPGDRELRLGTPLGLTNPMVFQVGTLPETSELEVNDPEAAPLLPPEPPRDLPVLLNGQIMPGDVDRFRFRAKAGQRLVVETSARLLVPYLADAVPGWCQVALALYDSKGKEVAFADDYRFDPDPVLFYEIPEDAEYELEVRDSLFRGREDFVYRIAVGELPFITRMFPLGGHARVRTVAAVDGWNLPRNDLVLDTRPGQEAIRRTTLRQDRRISNQVTYAVDTLPECVENEPNDDPAGAQEIALPRIVNGRVDRPGDVDVFRFEGRAGDQVVAEVFARRLRSPLDSLLRLTDASGRVLEWNDDYMCKEGDLYTNMGLLTQQADSCLSARLPARGTYYVRLTDAQNHGGEAYAYRLRIAPASPDFGLLMTPSSLSMNAGRALAFTVYALRKDGFSGEIEVVLKDNAPLGFVLSGARIPAGRDHVRMTLTAPADPPEQPFALELEGRAEIDGKTVTRRVVPSEDMMQAFLYRHLVPSQELLVVVARAKWIPPVIELATATPVRVPAGGTARVSVRAPRRLLRQVELELSDPAEGVTLQDVRIVDDGWTFELKVEGAAAKAGFADNLIVEAFTEVQTKPQDNKSAPPAGEKRRVSVGVLPAIPFLVVSP
ncbi:MAG: hypothetical protein V2A58_14590 [Planctomycetota bacterium]